MLKNQDNQGILNKHFSGKHIALVLSGGLEVREVFDLLNHLKAFSDLELSIYLHDSVLHYFTPEAFSSFGQVYNYNDSLAGDPSIIQHADLIVSLDWGGFSENLDLDRLVRIGYAHADFDQTLNADLLYQGNWQPVVEFLALRCADDLPWRGQTVLVTAGRTEEPIDPIRLITNRSSGKMGFALARQAALQGARVILVTGPNRLSTPYGVHRIDVNTADEMFGACDKAFGDADLFIAAAAVEDLKPVSVSEQKIKKNESMIIECTAAVDILHSLSRKKSHQYVVGFSVETENMLNNSRSKLQRKSLDAIVMNNPTEAGAGFRHDTNKATLIFEDGESVPFPLMSKDTLASGILKHILKKMQKHEQI